MTDGRADPLARLDHVAAALEDLRGQAASQPLEDIAKGIAESAVATLPDADAATITAIAEDGHLYTLAATDEVVIGIDECQYRTRRGPCVEAATQRRPVRAIVGEHEVEWPEFTAAAKAAGINTYLSVPVLLPGEPGGEDEVVGGLDMYSFTARAFDDYDEQVMRLFTTAACEAFTNARRWAATQRKIAQLETALTSRAEIDQAKGVLMAIHGCSADEAFTRLVEESQRTNTKLALVARKLLESLQR
ncbi:ANTAR domain-containing protein [Amycolatopsis thermalba]|uniref:ANTAR domain-containing protein n=1 Tax=Amycolatopsis thermalba TaxID=944492 RepID=A0ABY4P0M8_9PSEU|nr:MULTISPECIES: GAF and ANTAR domain-containing protein [Amycolatopsis]UQS25786.1 ANTAR domain-containing protein [Amycolatopsis thermalba]